MRRRNGGSMRGPDGGRMGRKMVLARPLVDGRWREQRRRDQEDPSWPEAERVVTVDAESRDRSDCVDGGEGTVGKGTTA